MISTNKSLKKKRLTEERHNFYLTFFNGDSKKEQVKEVNGFFLVRSYNPLTEQYQCSLYSKSSYLKYKSIE